MSLSLKINFEIVVVVVPKALDTEKINFIVVVVEAARHLTKAKYFADAIAVVVDHNNCIYFVAIEQELKKILVVVVKKTPNSSKFCFCSCKDTRLWKSDFVVVVAAEAI